MHKNSNLIILFLDISIILLPEFLIYFKPPENWWQRQFLHVQVVIIHIKIPIASDRAKQGKICYKFIEKYVNCVIIVYTDVENGRFKRTSKEGL